MSTSVSCFPWAFRAGRLASCDNLLKKALRPPFSGSASGSAEAAAEHFTMTEAGDLVKILP